MRGIRSINTAFVNDFYGSLGHGRYIRTFRGHLTTPMSTVAVSRGIYTTEYPVIVKYFSKSETPVDANYMMLRAEDMYTILRNISSASVPFRVVQTDKIIALVQNYVACSLYNRISTRPFFSSLEKRWITFLLCSAVADIHRAGVPSFLNSRIIL